VNTGLFGAGAGRVVHVELIIRQLEIVVKWVI
jgi:hypothetical protein